ncbi:hypothetical protein [Nonomuraea jabiensis]|uniref:hypothetical protein n=1 Tax=Nonomuraea jabiensis TaxID=882448 RepID=UPI003D7527FC
MPSGGTEPQHGWLRLGQLNRDAAAAGFEIGIHNPAFARTIALNPTLLNGAETALQVVVYGIVMFFTAAGFGRLIIHRDVRAPDSVGRAPLEETG